MMTDDVQQFAEMPKPVVIVDEEGNVLPADDPSLLRGQLDA